MDLLHLANGQWDIPEYTKPPCMPGEHKDLISSGPELCTIDAQVPVPAIMDDGFSHISGGC